MSSKARKSAALKALKAGRGGRLDDYELQEEEDVYDVYDEDEYQKLVESRRQREDFVVDDDGLGYYDDGEERLGDEDNDEPKKRKGGTTNLSMAALKKARKQKAAARANSNNETSEEGQETNSMWKFVQRGVKTTSTTQQQRQRLHTTSTAAQLDSLLDSLDDVGRTTLSVNKKTPRASMSHYRPAAMRRSKAPPRRSYQTPSSSHRAVSAEDETPHQYHHDENDDDDGAAWCPHDDDHDDDGVAAENCGNVDTPDATAALSEDSFNTPESQDLRLKKDSGEGNDVDVADENKIDGDEAPQQRRRLVRPKLGKVSAPVAKAETVQEHKKEQPELAMATSALSAVDTSSASFRPEQIAAETLAAEKAAANLESITQNDDESTYLDMFWMDAVESEGNILLFGKVETSENTFTSCCATIKGNKRNLFVLPRRIQDAEDYVSMVEVHQELKSILQPACIPLKEGASWAGKIVKRQYAFEDPTIPREETQYLKVVYDAQYPVPDQQVCQEGGKYIARIMGAGASNLENFIVKRNLLGPCWIRIRNPVACTSTSSWCKLEFTVESPKNVQRILESRPPPPVVTVSMKLKTIVNPKTHKSEVVSVSAICHKQVMLDTASDESTSNMTQLSLIRPLGTAAAEALPQFPRDIDQEINRSMPQLQKMPNERALLSRLFTQIGLWDPDVLVGHNVWGYDMQVLLNRCIELKVSMWSKIGRRRKMKAPAKKDHFANEWAINEALQGRVLCDTYLSAKELLRETTYSLSHLADTQLKTKRTEIEPVDIPHWYNASKTIVQLANHTLHDAQLVQRLMFKLQILPLTKQLTCVAGNLWSRTMKGNRAERTEYLLLHEFHTLKFIPPEKRRAKKDSASEKAKYAGGLVLEPKKGYYDSFILLLDFNSLYPSLIQEYNLCFTTMDWSNYIDGGDNNLPPVPDESIQPGVLPRVIKTLVERRRAVKKIMKSEMNPDKREELDIRQKALKLTANSMYGCLGFSNSRFFAQPIAALVTAMGRETLQRTVDIATNSIGLDVIYGDTDSIMINTRITDVAEYDKVRQLGEKVKQEVNKLYKTLELEIDGTFRSMLLLKKKKYAAVTAELGSDGNLLYSKEMKGLDLVRRDWCIQSKDTGRFVLDHILSGQDREVVIKNIHDHLEDLAATMRKGDLPLDKYVITKGLSKHPNDYPDGKSQPHVQVAKQMLQNNRPVNTGDHIPYVICEPLGEPKEKNPPAVDRAHHPEEIRRSGGALKPDVEWYLTQQILPPTSRLCEPIEGTSQSILAEKLGLDSTKYNQIMRSSGEIDDDELVDYTPASCLTDAERFNDVEKLMLTCQACGVTSEFAGVFCRTKEGVLTCGLRCANDACERPQFWGQPSNLECMAKISNAVHQLVYKKMREYYNGVSRCDDPACGLITRQVSVAGSICLARGCTGKLHAVVSERSLYTQMKYLDTLFDISHAVEQRRKANHQSDVPKAELLKTISKHDKLCLDELHKSAHRYIDGSAYNWIEASLWQRLFAGGVSTKQQV